MHEWTPTGDRTQVLVCVRQALCPWAPLWPLSPICLPLVCPIKRHQPRTKFPPAEHYYLKVMGRCVCRELISCVCVKLCFRWACFKRVAVPEAVLRTSHKKMAGLCDCTEHLKTSQPPSVQNGCDPRCREFPSEMLLEASFFLFVFHCSVMALELIRFQSRFPKLITSCCRKAPPPFFPVSWGRKLWKAVVSLRTFISGPCPHG